MKAHHALLAAVCAAVLLLAVFSQSRAAGDAWESDYAKALQTAKQTNRMVLLDFTGSDWCPACIQLDKDVFSQPEFKQYADKNLVLVTVDFPRRKMLPESTVTQNQMLQRRFSIDGFPTLVVVNPDGKQVGEFEEVGDVSQLLKALKALPKS